MRAVALTVSLTISTTLPVSLIGVIGDAAGADLGFGPAAVGAIAAAYWAASSLVSLTGSGIVSRLTSSQVMALSGGLALISLIGSMFVSPAWQWLLLWAAVGGAANAIGHAASNAWVQSRVHQGGRAFAFGAKQAAVPAASVVAGASLPLLVAALGWRWAFVPALAISATVVMLTIFMSRKTHRQDRKISQFKGGQGIPQRTKPYLLVVAATTFFAAAHSNSMGVFAVVGALDRDLGYAFAGALLIAASLIAVIVRVSLGILADRGIGGSLWVVSGLLGLGAFGLAAMSSPVPGVYIAGCLVAFSGSFGWPGLVHYVVAEVMGEATAGGTLITQSGSYLGSTIGPLVFGLTFAELGISVPWFLMAGCALLAAGIAAGAARLQTTLPGPEPTPAPAT